MLTSPSACAIYILALTNATHPHPCPTTPAPHTPTHPPTHPHPPAAALADQVRKLRAQLKARDNEINVLVSMLSKMEAGGRGLRDRHAQGAHTQGPPLPHDASVAASTVAVSLAGSEPGTSHPTPRPAVRPPAAPPGAPDTGASDTGVSDTGVSDAAALEALMDPSVLADRSRAFEIFRKSFRKNQAIEDNKAMLKAKYDATKALAQEVNAAKRDIQVGGWGGGVEC